MTATPYEILEVLHDGPVIRIERARYGSDGASVVLKRVVDASGSALDRALLRREYEVLAELAAAGVQGVARARELDDAGDVLILEDDVGETLTAWQRRTQPGLEDIIAVAQRLADILGHVHAAAVIHRDIKPANILVTPAGLPVLIDFGLATRMPRSIATALHPSALEGTLAYIAPEQTGRMNRAVDHRCDLYSLGVTLYELCTGRLPFTSVEPAELVHAHIARRPVPPIDLVPELPLAVSAIVSKLLAKDPEDRYRSAFGLAADLRQCTEALASHRELTLVPGALEVATRLQLSERLLGRDAERTLLRACLDRVSDGAAEVVLVTGPAGIGKSALLGELHRSLGAHGFFIAGKFDALRRDDPYSALREALTGLVRHVLSETPAELARWQQAIMQAAGGTLAALVHVIPELVAVVGPQPPLADVTPSAAKFRFQRAVQCLLRVFARPHSPVLLCLDDLQWADPASLDLLVTLFCEPDLGSLLFVGTHRDDPMEPGHPLHEMLAALSRFDARVSRIALTPLAEESVATMLAEALVLTPVEVAGLAALVARKTHGNPFFVGEFLRDACARGLLHFDLTSQRWTWNLPALSAASFTDNVVAWMVERTHAVAPGPREVLQVAACLGGSFTRDDLLAVVAAPASVVEDALLEAGRAELIIPAGRILRFVHDRVHQAFHDTMDLEQRRAAHLRIARRLHAHDPSVDLFALVDHYNQAIDLVVDADERHNLAGLNLRAVRRARAAGAFEQAARHAACGLTFLADDWSRDHDLAFALHHQAADCEFVCGQIDRSQALLATCLAHARSDLDRARVHASQSEAALHLDKLHDAIHHGIAGLRALGVELPADPGIGETVASVLHARWTLGRRTPAALASLPSSQDERTRWILKLYYHTSGAAFQVNVKLMTMIAMRATTLSIERGNTAFAAADYISFGMMLGAATQNYRTLEDYGQVALTLLERYPDRGVEAVVKFLYGSMLGPWSHPLRSSFPILRDAYQAGMDSGMLYYAGIASSALAMGMTSAGCPLPECEAACAATLKLVNRFGLAMVGRSATHLGRAVAVLQGHGEAWPDPDGDNEVSTHGAWLQGLELCLFLRRIDAARALVLRLEPGVARVFLIFHSLVTFHFFRVLTLTAHYPTDSLLARTRGLAKIRISLGKLASWARLNPAHFGHMHALAAAEYARILGDHGGAMQQYEQAIEGAKRHEFTQYAALACELAGRYYHQQGLASVADLHLVRARRGYLAWGAHAVVARLDAEFPALAPRSSGPATTHASGPQTTAAIDLGAVFRALAAIAGEIHVDGLLRTLLHLALENAGAERGWLVLDREGSWYVEATAIAAAPEQVDLTSIPWTSAPLPAAILHYAARTRESVVLDDAHRQGAFMHDSFVQSHRLRSLLCVPLINRGRLLGLLHLENNLTAGAFTAERCQVARFLAAQAAVSLEIAALYRKLEDYNRSLEARVDDRTRALQRALDDLRRAQRRMVESEKMAALGGLVAGVAHEINTPVGVGVTAASSLADRTHQLQTRYQAGQMSRSDLEQFIEVTARSGAIILANLGRAVELIQSFKQIAVDQSSEAPRSFRVGEYLDHLLLSLRPELKRTPHRLEVRGDRTLAIEGFPGALSQIITNLVMNSLTHAFADAGDTAAPAGHIVIDFHRDGDALVLRHSDDGQGIAVDDLPHIFEPFFTTRRERGGSGLGLSIVYNLATQKLGGSITCDSAPGHGTRFTLSFPTTFVRLEGPS